MQSSFFDLDNRYEHLSKSGDPLERLNRVIDWEVFRPILQLVDERPRKNNAGRKATDRVLMFKMLILQNKYNLSDEQLEFQVTDRFSFCRFLDLMLEGEVPDAKTVWAFRDALKEKGLLPLLLAQFGQVLLSLGVTLTSGQIIDATFVSAPIQRNKREENQQIKAGETPEDWKGKPAKFCQKDTDARWTSKRDIAYYGYKNHINIDDQTKLITAHKVSDASVHDSQVFEELLHDPNEAGARVYADSAYRSKSCEVSLQEKGLDGQIHERAYKNKPLTLEEKLNNICKSRHHARVEHVLGYMQTSMAGNTIRCIGLARAKVAVALKNLTYNLCRVEILVRQQFFAFDRFTSSKIS